MNTRSRTQPSRRVRKKKPISDEELQTRTQYHSVDSFIDSEIQQSNSQLSKTLSTNYNPKQISCREHEKEIITKFIKSCLSSEGEQNSRVLYVSGVPGVGKTVSTMEIINKIKKSISYKKATFKYINAMNLSSPSHLYKKINKEIYNPEKNDLTQNPPLKLMLKMRQDKRVKFLVIDQVDYLYTRNQNVLYNLFEWCSTPSTRLCCIIIANTMDFPQRLMPKIKSRMGDNRLVFKPYSQNEVQKIIEQRLMKSNRFSKDAVVYACKKMSAFTSDVRKLLDVLKRALERKQQGIISLDEMFQSWRKFAQQSGELWQQKLPQFYRNIITIIKDQGGFTTLEKVHGRMCVKQSYEYTETLDALKQMQQMSIISLKQKNKRGLKSFEVTLLKI